MSLDAYLDLAQREFDPSATLYAGAGAIPSHWMDYAQDTQAQRLAGLRLEMQKLAPYFPKTATGLTRNCVDAFLVQTERRGICRILVRQIGGEVYLAYSRLPRKDAQAPARPTYQTLKDNAPKALSWTYENLMDGLVDSYGLTGFVPSDMLYSMAEVEEYMDYDWYPDFSKERDLEKVLEIFSSGGGGYLLLDLNRDLGAVEAPEALRISAKEADWTPSNPVPFWPFMDAWMAIGLVES